MGVFTKQCPELHATCDRGQQQNFVAFLESVGLSAKEADVFLVHINIEEAADLPFVVAQMRLQVGKFFVQDQEQLSEIRRCAGDRTDARSVAAQCSRNLHGDRHGYAPTASASAITPGISEGLNVA